MQTVGQLPTATTYHAAVNAFRARLLLDALTAHGGNRTRTAATLGLQRTYLLRLMRQMGVSVPAPRRGR